jgi:large subunit ribosomal protein L9
MKVILNQDVKTLGKKGVMVEVSDGYARNFLFPKGLAIEANTSNINTMQQKQQSEKSKKDRELAAAKALAAKISATKVVFKVKAGENGKLFGSITSKDISDRLKSDFGLDIDKKKIHLPEALKNTGTVEVDIKLYPEVAAKLPITIEFA